MCVTAAAMGIKSVVSERWSAAGVSLPAELANSMMYIIANLFDGYKDRVHSWAYMFASSM